jgi:hypothetical protein
MKTVRAFSEAGPCITLGAVLRETDHCVSYRDRQGATTLISIDRTVHTEPCPSVSVVRVFETASSAN